MNENSVAIVDQIERRIYFIRGVKVMLDRDLAYLYGVETRVLNQAVKRHMKRFPNDFMFQLTRSEFENLKSQIVTSSWGGIRKMPYAFTEQVRAITIFDGHVFMLFGGTEEKKQ